jgi:hypothetical protein
MRETAPPRTDPIPEAERDPELDADDADIDVEVTPPRRPPITAAATVAAIALAIVVLGGIGYRIWLALGPLGRAPNSDETVVGLMALRLWRHHQVSPFFWHQQYGGSLQAILMAPIVGLFGTSVFSLRILTTLEGIAAPIVTWRIARHFFRPRVALLAGVVALWWPLSLVYYSTQERLFYSLGALIGLFAVLMAVNIDEKPALLRHWLALGLSVGIGWWLSPNIIYYALPIILYLLLRGHWRQWRGIAVAAVTFIVGSSVWTVANVHSGFKSLRSPELAGSSTYLSRLGFFFQTGLPFSLGLRHTWTTKWFGGSSFGHWMFAVGIVMLVVALVLAVRRIRSSASILVLLVAIAPLVYAWFPPTWRLAEGRYLYFFASLLPLLVCEVMQFRVGQVVVLGFVAITAVAFIRDYGTTPQGPTVTAIARVLDANGYHTAVANYWIAYNLTYATGEHVIASPLPGETGARYAPYIREIEASRPAYLFVNLRRGTHDLKLIHALDQAHIGYRVVTGGAYVAVLPDKPFIMP